MFRWLFGKRKVYCWAIKQIDRQVLHLCPMGKIESDLEPDDLLKALRDGRFSGDIRLGDSGSLLNAQMFEAVVHEAELQQDEEGMALWRGRRWMVSQVPEHSWSWTGRLVASHRPMDFGPQLVSNADINMIHQRGRRPSPPLGKVVAFGGKNALEEPSGDCSRTIEYGQRNWERFKHLGKEVG